MIDPRIAQLMQQSRAAPPVNKPMGPGAQPPGGSPMAVPDQKVGMQAAAKVKVQMAIRVLEQAFPVFGVDSDEGSALLKAMQQLGKTFGKSASESENMMPAEIAQLMAAMKQGTPPQAQPQKPAMPPQGQPQQPMMQ